MERLIQVAAGVAGLLNSPSVSVYWVYLVTAGILAAVVYLRSARKRATARGLVAFLLPRQILSHRSARNDLAVAVLNTLLHSFVFVVPLQTVSTTVATHGWRLLYQMHAFVEPLNGPVAWAAFTLALFVLADLAFFISHLLAHRIPALWELHKVHHSAPVLTPLTVFRRHPIEVFLDGLISGVILGVGYGAIGWLAGSVISGYEVLGVNVLLFGALFIGFNLQHSHVWMTWGPLERVLISPAAHQIHHSSAPEHHDRNFGNMLCLWDRLVGTYTSPPSTRLRLEFGIGAETDEYRSVWRLYLIPVFRIFVRNRPGRGTTTES